MMSYLTWQTTMLTIYKPSGKGSSTTDSLSFSVSSFIIVLVKKDPWFWVAILVRFTSGVEVLELRADGREGWGTENGDCCWSGVEDFSEFGILTGSCFCTENINTFSCFSHTGITHECKCQSSNLAGRLLIYYADILISGLIPGTKKSYHMGTMIACIGLEVWVIVISQGKLSTFLFDRLLFRVAGSFLLMYNIDNNHSYISFRHSFLPLFNEWNHLLSWLLQSISSLNDKSHNVKFSNQTRYLTLTGKYLW